jgi:hypothetical protein
MWFSVGTQMVGQLVDDLDAKVPRQRRLRVGVEADHDASFGRDAESRIGREKASRDDIAIDGIVDRARIDTRDHGGLLHCQHIVWRERHVSKASDTSEY